MRFAVTMDQRLVRKACRADVERLSIAEVARLVGAEAERLELVRPSYDAVRRLVLVERERRRERREALLEAVDQLWAYHGVDTGKLTAAMLATRRSARSRAG